MKKTGILMMAAVLALSVLTLSGCGKSEFGVTDNTEKRMVISAENADKDAFFMVGTLVAEEGDEIVIAGNLKKGQIEVALIGEDEEQSIDKLPDTDKDPLITANVKGTDKISGGLPAGEYSLKATCLEKATGTIEIEVKPH